MSCSSCGRASSTVCGCRTNRCCRYVSLLGGTIQHDFSGREGNLSWTCGHIKIPSIHLPPLNPGPGRSSSCLSRDTQTSLSPECPGSPPGVSSRRDMPGTLPEGGILGASETDARATSAGSSWVTERFTLSLTERPATLRRKLVLAACIQDLILLVMTQSL